MRTRIDTILRDQFTLFVGIDWSLQIDGVPSQVTSHSVSRFHPPTTPNKKAATEMLLSDSGPTISFINLQK
jgi:hypothetical protein